MTEDRIARAREALERLKPPLRVEAFNEVLCGDENCSAMIVRDEDPSCAAIIAQNLSDQDAHDIVSLINSLASLPDDVSEERERCAKIAETRFTEDHMISEAVAGRTIAAAIRKASA